MRRMLAAALAAVRTFMVRVRAYVRPLPGWKARVHAYNNGRYVWESPVPGTPRLTPYPFEWVLGRVDLHEPRGWVGADATCVVTGKALTPNGGARCARCGVPVHNDVACGANLLAVPACPWCRARVERAAVTGR